METRIAELGGGVSPATPAQRSDTDDQFTAGNADPQTAGSAEATATTVRDDGIEVHPGGRLLVPDTRFQSGSRESWQRLALVRHLKHAAIGVFPDTLVPSDNPVLMADAAREYLALADVRPYFCTREEMISRQPDCMDFSDASYAFAVAGGTFGNGAVEARKPNPFLWWRGANEFARKRSIAGFVDSGLRDRIVETAPDTPIRLLFKVGGVLDTYDFDAGNFPVLVGRDRIAVPGSKSVAFGAAEVAQPIEIPRDKAEALQQMLESRGDGRAEIVIGVAVDLAPEQPHAGQPRWQSKVVSSDYYIDPDATVPLAGASGTGQQTGAMSPAEPETATTAQATASASGSVLRPFDLRREDGRIVLAFEGYGEPAASTQEAVKYVVASASRDLLQAVAEAPSRYNIPLLRAILRQDLRDRLLGPAGFAGETEFEVRRAKTAFEEEVAPKLVADAPSLPIPMRLYLDATLDEYNFEQESIGLRVFQESGLRIGGSYPISLEPFFDLAPAALPMAPDAAERLVTAADAGPGPVLRLDFDIMTTRLNGVEFLMTPRPSAVALVTGENRDVVHFQETYDRAEDAESSAEAARAFLGPEPADAAVPSHPADYPVLGVAPGMDVETAIDGLSRHFSDAEIDQTGDLLRAERGWCGYESVESDALDDAQGAVCFVARVTDGRIARIALQRVVSTGKTADLLKTYRDAFGTQDSHWDRGAPAGSLGREILGWGAQIDRDRPALGRADAGMAPREAELGIVYLNPQISVVTLRADAAAPDGQRGSSDAETQSTPAAKPEPQTPSTDARGLSVVGIRLGMPREEAMNALHDVGRVIYRAEVAPAEPQLVQDRYTLAVLDNGETFALHTAAGDGSPVIGLARKIPVGSDVPLSAIRDAVVDSYGEPGFEEKDGGGWTTWRWEPSGNRSDAGIPCVQHFIDGFGSGQPPKIVDEVKDADAISAAFDGAAKFANRGDESFFRFYLKDRAPRLGLDMQDRLGDCDAFLNIRVMPSQTQSDQIRVYLVDPAAFTEELKAHSADSGAAEFDSKF